MYVLDSTQGSVRDVFLLIKGSQINKAMPCSQSKASEHRNGLAFSWARICGFGVILSRRKGI